MVYGKLSSFLSGPIFGNMQQYLDILTSSVHKPDQSLHIWKIPLSGPLIILMSIHVYAHFVYVKFCECTPQGYRVMAGTQFLLNVDKSFTNKQKLAFV